MLIAYTCRELRDSFPVLRLRGHADHERLRLQKFALLDMSVDACPLRMVRFTQSE